MADDAVVPDVAHLAELDAESNEKYPPAPTATPLLLDAPADMVTAADRYPPHPEQPDLTPAEAVVFRLYRYPADAPAHMARQLKGWPDGDLASPVAVAHVNHGRWLADCPFGCNSSQYAEPTDRRLFCINCANGDTMKWVPVKWPDDLEVAAVEAALSIRPDPQTRSWRPPETAGDLVAENKAKGLT